MYLYQLNYPPQEKDFCYLEMRQLFGHMPENHLIFSDYNYEAGRSVYFKSKLNVVFQSTSLAEICLSIQESGWNCDQFKVIYIKNENDVLTYEQRLDALRQISGVIQGACAMNDPKVQLGLTLIKDTWYFGWLEKDHRSWQKHLNKPQSYSQSLDVRMARTLINIAACGSLACQLIDPCCGVGTVVLEGLSMGHHIEGSDIHRGICWKANRNLSYFGYPLLIENRDIAQITKMYDACILDIPYNLYSTITPEQQQEIINHTYRIAQTLVMISHENLSLMLEKSGWFIRERCQTGKMKFKRYIYVCKKA